MVTYLQSNCLPIYLLEGKPATLCAALQVERLTYKELIIWKGKLKAGSHLVFQTICFFKKKIKSELV